jgi:hypothetical protein
MTLGFEKVGDLDGVRASALAAGVLTVKNCFWREPISDRGLFFLPFFPFSFPFFCSGSLFSAFP